MSTVKEIHAQVQKKFQNATSEGAGYKRTVLFQLHSLFGRLQIREAQSQTGEVNEIVLKMMNTPGHDSAIVDLFKTYKLDATPLVQALFASVQKRHPQAITLTGELFASVTLIQPQTKELCDSLLKSIKATQSDLRKVCYACLAQVWRSGHALPDLKTMIKNPDKDFAQDWFSCLTAAVVGGYPSQPLPWPQLWPDLQLQAIRQLETGASSLMLALMECRLKEAQLQGKLEMSYREFNALAQSKDKKKLVFVEAPRNMSDVVEYCFQVVGKISQGEALSDAQKNVCSGVAHVLATLLKEFAANFESVPEFTKKLLQIQNPNFIVKTLAAVSDVFRGTEYETKLILDLYQQCSKKSKMPEAAIAALNHISTSQQEDVVAQLLTQAGVTSQQFVDTMLHHAKRQSGCEVACTLIQTIARTSPSWLHSFVSLFISCVQIQSADISSVLHGNFVYTGAKQLESEVIILNRQSETLAELFLECQTVLGGEPLALTNAAFQTASNFVAGKQVTKLIQQGLNSVTLDEAGRREHGWIIIDGLIKLGPQWATSHLIELVGLFEAQFSKQMCQLDPNRLANDAQYREIYLQEFKVKSKALKAMHSLLKYSLWPKKTMQQLSRALSNSLEFLLFLDKSTESLLQPQEVAEVRSHLFACYDLIPCQLYQSKLVKLLHNVCEHLVSSQADLPNGFLDPEDDCLTGQQESEEGIKSAMALFIKIFRCGIITSTNKDQLLNHFVLHTNQSVKKVKQANGEVVSQPAAYRPDKIKKMRRLGATLIQAVRQSDNLKVFSAQLTNIRHNLLKPNDALLVRISAELQIELEASSILHNGPWFMFNSIDEQLSKPNCPAQKLKESAALCGLYMRHFQPQDCTERLTKIFTKLLSSPAQDVLEFATHYACQIADPTFIKEVTPAVYSAFYDNCLTSSQLDAFARLCWQDSSTQAQIILQDHKKAALAQMAKAGKICQQHFDSLDNCEIVQALCENDQVDQMESKLNGKLKHHVIMMIQRNTPQAKDLYKRLTSKESAVDLVTFLKSDCMSYVHHSPGKDAQNLFKEPLAPQTLEFLITCLREKTQKIVDNHKQVVEVMHFALATTTNSQTTIKLSALKLLRDCLHLLRYTVEVVGDQDEDLTAEEQARQNYTNNPLLVEQFEAQIFSVIRQGLSSQSTSVQMEIFALIRVFITMPVTSDPGLLKKIFGMLVTPKMHQSTFIFQSAQDCESAVVNSHFAKLTLLADLYTYKIPKPDLYESKFTCEHLSELQECLQPHLKCLTEHWRTALNDLHSETLPKNKVFLQAGLSSAGLDVAGICDALRQASHESCGIVNAIVIQFLKRGFQESEGLAKWYEEKIAYLKLAGKVDFGEEVQGELLNILAHLTKLGIAEITYEVLQIYLNLTKQDQVVYLTLGILLQANPDLSQQLSSTKMPHLAHKALEVLTKPQIVREGTDDQVRNYMEQVYCRLVWYITQPQEVEQEYHKAVLQITDALTSEALSNCGEQVVQALAGNPSAVNNVILTKVVNKMSAKAEVFGLLSDHPQLETILPQLTLPPAQTKLFFAFVVAKAFNQSSFVTQDLLQWLVTAYTKLDLQERVATMPVVLALLFGVIQTPQHQARMFAANQLRVVFSPEQQACVRQVALSKDANGQPMITPVEQQAIKKIVQAGL